MRIFILFASFTFLACFPLSAQNKDSVAIKKYYEENTILWLGWTKYYKNNQLFPLRNLKKEIILSPDAIHEFGEYRRNRVIMETGLIVSTGLLVSSLFVKDRQVKLGMLAGSIVTASISFPVSIITGEHLSRAVWLHNRDILLR